MNWSNEVIRHREEFATWGEFLEAAEKVSRQAYWNSARSGGPSHSWDSMAGFTGALALARNGWAKGEEMVQRMSTALFDKVASHIEREYPVYDVEGTGLDVARYLEGEPECWLRMEYRESEGPGHKRVRVVLNGSVSAAVRAETIQGKGAAVVALVQLLEYAGHSVELIWVNAIVRDYKSDTIDSPAHSSGVTVVKLKAAEQPVDVARVAFALAHPAMFRRLGFSVMEHWPYALQVQLGGSRGHCSEAPAEYRNDSVYIPAAIYQDVQWSNAKAAEGWVVTKLREQGLTLNFAEGADPADTK